MTAAEPAGAGPRRLHLHVGLPKSGTTYVQAVLADNRDRLREAGFIYPFVRREAMFHAAVEIRGQERQWGLDPAAVAGTWDRLLDRARTFPGSAVVSHELLAGAGEEQAARALARAEDFEVHLVVTARDLGRQVTAHWQEEVKNGRPWSFAELEADLFEPAESAETEQGFWRSQDLPGVLARWSAQLPPERVHVVVAPRPGADPAELWRRFATALGLAPDAVDLSVVTFSNESLGAAQVALLRQVVRAVGDRLEQPWYAHVVKRFFAQSLLSRVGSPRAVPPAELVDRLVPVAQGWAVEVERRGYRVHGDLRELVPSPPEPGVPHPDDVTADEVLEGLPEVLADLLVEVARLRSAASAASGEVESSHEAPSPRRRPGLAVRGRRLWRPGR